MEPSRQPKRQRTAQFDSGRDNRIKEEPDTAIFSDPHDELPFIAPPPSSQPEQAEQPSFDAELFTTIVGERLTTDKLKQLENAAGGNMERAINMYFDGSWKNTRPTQIANPLMKAARQQASKKRKESDPVIKAESTPEYTRPKNLPFDKRYLGVLQAEGWTTCSGTNLLQYGERVTIHREKLRTPAPAKKGTAAAKGAHLRQRKTADLIVRFKNSRGFEVGRLEQDMAKFVSVLIDQRLCSFDGTVVYAPEQCRMNDTVYLQLRVFLLGEAFDQNRNFKETRVVGDLFTIQETEEEKDVRQRQASLVRLFDKIGLEAVVKGSGMDAKKEILKAAESLEEIEAKSKAGTPKPVIKKEGGEEEEEEGEELEQDQLDELYRKAQSFDFDSPEAEPSETFAMDLRRYQKQALNWMLSKERNESLREGSMNPLWDEYKWPTVDEEGLELMDAGQGSFYANLYSGEMSLQFPKQEQNCLGGILADEMGLGKTIQMLALIHSNIPEGIEVPKQSNDLLPYEPKVHTIDYAPYTTLVVAPMSLLSQWESECDAASKPNTLKTMVYYAAGREDLRKLCTGHNLMSAPNVIITSYGTVLSEFSHISHTGTDRVLHGGLFSIRFNRIILDEAHNIKNRNSKTAKACYELEANHRWVLTGTPIVNRLEDLFSLVRFLRVEPWGNFAFWRTFITVPFEEKNFLKALDMVQTVLEPLVMRRTKDMKLPDGSPLVPLPPRDIMIEQIDLSEQERLVYDHIYNKVSATVNANIEGGTLFKSYTSILAQILRLRQSCCHPTLVRRKDVVADEEEADAARDAANGFADDMDLAALIDKFTASESQETQNVANVYGAHVLKQIKEESNISECPICMTEEIENLTVTGCFHAACKECWMQHIDYQKKHDKIPLCVACRAPINDRDLFEVIREPPSALPTPTIGTEPPSAPCLTQSSTEPTIRLRRLNRKSSSKINTLISKLLSFKSASPPDLSKSIVFSQFTSFLDLIEPELKLSGIPYLRLDGTTPQATRKSILSRFSDSPLPLVLLLSLRTGGVGLNLVAAQNVFLMDPWWSWAVESQAIDRVHRMGQKGKVRVWRFVVRGSVEERMLRVQEKKKFLAGTLGMMGKEEMRSERIEDIKVLLGK
ncbi:hypothetical protein BJ508DRAFT_238456 [Ascobolus immersus RN42]|uniref:DNA repair protein rad5 n=1 Tax=Ascobolus immersus RN42 TaxID=1160509 RepID=A0A3N4IKG8_ASCIM|nr:hypothetical protein BJ508DRAFT_238456 [Ascobolus immersus RN42]